MPIWAISAPRRSAGPGSILPSRPGAELFRQGAAAVNPGAAALLFLRWCRTGCIIPWWRWPPSPPSSPPAVISRRLSHHPPGGAAGPAARMEIRHTSAEEDGPDLCAQEQRHAGGGRGADRADLQEPGRPGRAYGIAVRVMVISTALVAWWRLSLGTGGYPR